MSKDRLDIFDRKILAALQDCGDLGSTELSAIVNLSPSQCSRRLQRLKQEHYLDRIVALLSPKRLNLGVSAYVAVQLRSHGPDDENAFLERVASLSEVTSCESLTGEADFMLRVSTRDLESYNRFLSAKLRVAPEIDNVRSSIVLESFKSTTALSLDFC